MDKKFLTLTEKINISETMPSVTGFKHKEVTLLLKVCEIFTKEQSQLYNCATANINQTTVVFKGSVIVLANLIAIVHQK